MLQSQPISRSAIDTSLLAQAARQTFTVSIGRRKLESDLRVSLCRVFLKRLTDTGSVNLQ
jgi:hypothetical protein